MNTVFSKKRGGVASAVISLSLICFLAGAFSGIPRAVFALGTGVPTSDIANTTQNTVTAGKTSASLITQGKSLAESTVQTAKLYQENFKEWVGDGLVKYIAQTTLRGITQSVVNWINNDFQGSPSFVTNPEGFLSNIANKVIGRTIAEIDPLWCEPFRLQLRGAFGISYGFEGAKEEIGCKLTDVIANVQGAYDSFVGGNFTQGGWKSWISITGNQQSNGYGAYLNTVNKLDASIVTASGREIKLLDWGQGFRSWRKCLEPGPEVIATNSKGENLIGPDEGYIMKPGPCLKEGPIETPGSIIQDNLKKALDSDLMGLNFADEINEIVAALANKLIQKVMTAGVAGSSDYVEASYAQGKTTVPGYCDDSESPNSPLNPSSAKYQARLDPGSREYNKAFAEARLVRCQISSHSFSVNLNADSLFSNDSRAKAESDYKIASGDKILTADDVTNDADTKGKREANDAAGAVVIPGGGVGTNYSSFNLVLGQAGGHPRVTRQSSMDNRITQGPEKGNDGNKRNTLGATGASVILTRSESRPWWEVDLGDSYSVGEVRIWPTQHGNRLLSTYLGGRKGSTDKSYVFLCDHPYDYGGISSSPPFFNNPFSEQDCGGGVEVILPQTSEQNFISVNLNKTGRYLRVQRNDTGQLSFSEVEAFQTDTNQKSPNHSANLLSLQSGEGGGQTRKGIYFPLDTAQATRDRWNSAFPEYRSSNGIDGNSNGDWRDSNASLVGFRNPASYWDTWREGINLPWWETSLGGRKDVREVVIWPRTDSNLISVLSDTYVYVTNTPYDGTLPTTKGVLVPITSPNEPEKRPIVVSFPPGTSGSYVRIQRNVWNDNLWFSEVLVFSESATDSAVSNGSPEPSVIIAPAYTRFTWDTGDLASRVSQGPIEDPERFIQWLRAGVGTGNSYRVFHSPKVEILGLGGGGAFVSREWPSFVIQNISNSQLRDVQLKITLSDGVDDELVLGNYLDSFKIVISDAVTGEALPGLPEKYCSKFSLTRRSNADCELDPSSSSKIDKLQVPSFSLAPGQSAKVTYELVAKPASEACFNPEINSSYCQALLWNTDSISYELRTVVTGIDNPPPTHTLLFQKQQLSPNP